MSKDLIKDLITECPFLRHALGTFCILALILSGVACGCAQVWLLFWWVSTPFGPISENLRDIGTVWGATHLNLRVFLLLRGSLTRLARRIGLES